MKQHWISSQYNKHCRYCGSKQNLTKDHILPKSRGGSNTNRNYQILCSFCNHSKSNLTDVEIANIFRDVKSRGVWYPWEDKYKRWLNYIEVQREENGLNSLNWG